MTIRFSYTNLVDAADLDPSSQLATLPADNLQDPRPTAVWRTNGCTEESIVIDLGAPAAATLAALLEHNLSSAATVSLQANSADSWTSPPFSTSLDWHSSIIIKFFAQTSYRYWRLVLADSANPDGYLQIGRLWLGDCFQPARDFSRDFSLRRVDPSEVSYGDSGSRVVSDRTPYRIATIKFPSTDEKDAFDQMIDAVGAGGDFIAALDPASQVWSDGLHDYTLYCHLDGTPEWGHRVNDSWSLSMRLRETI